MMASPMNCSGPGGLWEYFRWNHPFIRGSIGSTALKTFEDIIAIIALGALDP